MNDLQVVDKKVEMDLTSINGNAFAIMAHFQKNARLQGWTYEEIDAVITKAKSGDYDNLLCVIMAHTE